VQRARWWPYSCKWDVNPLGTGGQFPPSSKACSQLTQSEDSIAPSPILSTQDSASTRSTSALPGNPETSPVHGLKSASDNSGKEFRVVFLCEQVMHHPPVSAFYAECREKGISMSGNDQLSAHFTGTCISPHICDSSHSVAIKVYAGKLNKGIFINLNHRDDEEYNLTHPCAHVTGFISLKFHPYVTVSDACYITCPKTKLKAILKYSDEVISGGWFEIWRFRAGFQNPNTPWKELYSVMTLKMIRSINSKLYPRKTY